MTVKLRKRLDAIYADWSRSQPAPDSGILDRAKLEALPDEELLSTISLFEAIKQLNDAGRADEISPQQTAAAEEALEGLRVDPRRAL